MNSTPNILVIMYDQLTPSALGCYGNRATKSPHIDRLAAAGVCLTRRTPTVRCARRHGTA